MTDWFSKWVWKDWLSDPAVHTSSLAAQGLWMQMLCLAAAHDPPGYVALNGAKVDEIPLLARLTGAPPDEIKLLLYELEHNHVFSRNKVGTIFNRRMVKKENLARISRENGKLGGNPTLCKPKVLENSDNPKPTSGISLARAKLEVIKKDSLDPTDPLVLPVREKRAQKKRTEYPQSFEAFWKAYPTSPNMPKTKTFAAWKKLDDDDRKLAVDSIPAFKVFCASKRDYEPVYAERYLSQHRFEGHLQTSAKLASRGVFVKRGTPQWEAWVGYWQENGKGKEPPSHNGGWHFPTAYPPSKQR